MSPLPEGSASGRPEQNLSSGEQVRQSGRRPGHHAGGENLIVRHIAGTHQRCRLVDAVLDKLLIESATQARPDEEEIAPGFASLAFAGFTESVCQHPQMLMKKHLILRILK